MTITPYTLKELSVLVEEYITQQHSLFTLRGLFSYIVFWGMGDRCMPSRQLPQADQERVSRILDHIVRDGWIRVRGKEST